MSVGRMSPTPITSSTSPNCFLKSLSGFDHSNAFATSMNVRAKKPVMQDSVGPSPQPAILMKGVAFGAAAAAARASQPVLD